ncbi:MAG: dihydrolipoyl dehydrogenase [Candidatus Hinthialibacter antarcticus]|nr:dihydrolipoyl dehydrogenase [Candidatus Hinthialibacter antarcticus]
MSNTQYDLIVIGAGPGGYVAAIRAAQLGFKTACVDKQYLGGTCLNVGCIPSKALLDSSHHFYEAKNSLHKHGVKIGQLDFDVSAMIGRKEKIVKIMTGGINGLFRKNKVDKLMGLGSVVGATTVEVEDGKEKKQYKTKRILIASGSVPIELPNLPFDGERIVSSTEALCFGEVPKRMVVIGAGAIGLELGSVWNRLGSEVTVIELTPNIMPLMDLEMTVALKKSLEKQGLKFKMETKADTAKVTKNGVKLSLKGPDGDETLDCDKLLVAVGRKPCTDGLNLDAAGVKVSDRGRIEVDEHYETNVKGVFAIGDVIAGPMLAHKAEEEGMTAVERMAGIAAHVNYDAIPNVVYTHPEVASVGITEEQAKDKGVEYKVGKFPFMANGRARCMDEEEGMVKIISDAKTDRMLGMHIMSARASDIIAEGAIAMEFHSSAEDIARSVHAHPTLPEAIKEAALAVDGRAIHI